MSAATTINTLIKEFSDGDLLKPGEVSDGYHTFDELYDHRCLLFIHLCKTLSIFDNDKPIWRSVKNSDGSTWKGWFIMGIHKEEGKQITYHLPYKYWDHTAFAETLDKGIWDGHTSDDVIQRLIIQL